MLGITSDLRVDLGYQCSELEYPRKGRGTMSNRIGFHPFYFKLNTFRDSRISLASVKDFFVAFKQPILAAVTAKMIKSQSKIVQVDKLKVSNKLNF